MGGGTRAVQCWRSARRPRLRTHAPAALLAARAAVAALARLGLAHDLLRRRLEHAQPRVPVVPAGSPAWAAARSGARPHQARPLTTFAASTCDNSSAGADLLGLAALAHTLAQVARGVHKSSEVGCAHAPYAAAWRHARAREQQCAHALHLVAAWAGRLQRCRRALADGGRHQPPPALTGEVASGRACGRLLRACACGGVRRPALASLRASSGSAACGLAGAAAPRVRRPQPGNHSTRADGLTDLRPRR